MTKRITIFLLLIGSYLKLYCNQPPIKQFFDINLSSGFLWKIDHCYKEIFGQGIVDVLTLDVIYYPWKNLGFGIRSSYFRETGTACRNPASIEEFPTTLFLRGKIGNRLQGYASLGGGVVFVHEKKSCGTTNNVTGILDTEIGFNYYFCKSVHINAAFFYMFSRKKMCCRHADFGGYGLRGGIGFSF